MQEADGLQSRENRRGDLMVQEATVHPGQDDEHLTGHPQLEQFRAMVPHNMTTVPLNITEPEQGKATMNIGYEDVLRLAQELGVGPQSVRKPNKVGTPFNQMEQPLQRHEPMLGNKI